MPILSLPDELLLTIIDDAAGFPGQRRHELGEQRMIVCADLARLALVCRVFNRIAMGLLYSEVSLVVSGPESKTMGRQTLTLHQNPGLRNMCKFLTIDLQTTKVGPLGRVNRLTANMKLPNVASLNVRVGVDVQDIIKTVSRFLRDMPTVRHLHLDQGASASMGLIFWCKDIQQLETLALNSIVIHVPAPLRPDLKLACTTLQLTRYSGPAEQLITLLGRLPQLENLSIFIRNLVLDTDPCDAATLQAALTPLAHRLKTLQVKIHQNQPYRYLEVTPTDEPLPLLDLSAFKQLQHLELQPNFLKLTNGLPPKLKSFTWDFLYELPQATNSKKVVAPHYPCWGAFSRVSRDWLFNLAEVVATTGTPLKHILLVHMPRISRGPVGKRKRSSDRVPSLFNGQFGDLHNPGCGCRRLQVYPWTAMDEAGDKIAEIAPGVKLEYLPPRAKVDNLKEKKVQFRRMKEMDLQLWELGTLRRPLWTLFE